MFKREPKTKMQEYFSKTERTDADPLEIPRFEPRVGFVQVVAFVSPKTLNWIRNQRMSLRQKADFGGTGRALGILLENARAGSTKRALAKGLAPSAQAIVYALGTQLAGSDVPGLRLADLARVIGLAVPSIRASLIKLAQIGLVEEYFKAPDQIMGPNGGPIIRPPAKLFRLTVDGMLACCIDHPDQLTAETIAGLLEDRGVRAPIWGTPIAEEEDPEDVRCAALERERLTLRQRESAQAGLPEDTIAFKEAAGVYTKSGEALDEAENKAIRDALAGVQTSDDRLKDE